MSETFAVLHHNTFFSNRPVMSYNQVNLSITKTRVGLHTPQAQHPSSHSIPHPLNQILNPLPPARLLPRLGRILKPRHRAKQALDLHLPLIHQLDRQLVVPRAIAKAAAEQQLLVTHGYDGELDLRLPDAGLHVLAAWAEEVDARVDAGGGAGALDERVDAAAGGIYAGFF